MKTAIRRARKNLCNALKIPAAAVQPRADLLAGDFRLHYPGWLLEVCIPAIRRAREKRLAGLAGQVEKLWDKISRLLLAKKTPPVPRWKRFR